MANVIVRKEKVGRPIWLKQRSLEAVVAKLVFIGINQIGIRVALQEFHDVEKRVGFDDVIMIEKSDPFPAGKRESLIRCCRDSSMFSEALQGESPVTSGEQR